jgi:hypothetical protein
MHLLRPDSPFRFSIAAPIIHPSRLFSASQNNFHRYQAQQFENPLLRDTTFTEEMNHNSLSPKVLFTSSSNLSRIADYSDAPDG